MLDPVSVLAVKVPDVEPGHGCVAGVQDEIRDPLEVVQRLAGVEADAAVSPDLDGEHVLDGHDDPGPRGELGQLVLDPHSKSSLPPVRGMDDDDGGSELLGEVHGPVDLPGGLRTPHASSQQQERRVDGRHLQSELLRQAGKEMRLLRVRVLRHHDLHSFEPGLGGVTKGLPDGVSEERSRGEQQTGSRFGS